MDDAKVRPDTLLSIYIAFGWPADIDSPRAEFRYDLPGGSLPAQGDGGRLKWVSLTRASALPGYVILLDCRPFLVFFRRAAALRRRYHSLVTVLSATMVLVAWYCISVQGVPLSASNKMSKMGIGSWFGLGAPYADGAPPLFTYTFFFFFFITITFQLNS